MPLMIKWQKKHDGGISWTRKKFKHRLQLLVKARMVAQVNFMATQQALERAWPCCSGSKGSAKGKQAEQQKKCNTCGGVTQGLVQTAEVHDACDACCCRYEYKDELFMKCHTLSQMLPGFAETRTEEAKDEKATCKTCAGPRRTTFELKTGSDPIAELFSGPEVRTQIEEVCTPIEVCTQLRKLRCLEEVHTQIEEVRTQIEVHMQLRRMRVHIQLAEDAIQTGT